MTMAGQGASALYEKMPEKETVYATASYQWQNAAGKAGDLKRGYTNKGNGDGAGPGIVLNSNNQQDEKEEEFDNDAWENEYEQWMRKQNGESEP